MRGEIFLGTGGGFLCFAMWNIAVIGLSNFYDHGAFPVAISRTVQLRIKKWDFIIKIFFFFIKQ